jgi:hypothetical protein
LAVGLAAAGCGSTVSPSDTSSPSAFRSSLAGAQAQLHAIEADLAVVIARIVRRPGSERGTDVAALAARAQDEAGTLARLEPPVRFNTRLRALESSLEQIADVLTDVENSAGEHDTAGVRSELGPLRVDAADAKLTDAAVLREVGLSGS